MNSPPSSSGEGSLEAPVRHALDWKNPEFYDKDKLFSELERVYDICHGCRRCVSLCNAFPTLFDLVDESDTLEVDGVAKADFKKVVDQCYLCDLCYLTKCPYVPPHEWQVDFPHLMLRAKAWFFKTQGVKFRDKLLSSTDKMGAFASLPVIAPVVNAANKNTVTRKITQSLLGIDANARLPEYQQKTFRKQYSQDINQQEVSQVDAQADDRSQGKVILYVTCYGNYNEPALPQDLKAVYQHNGIQIELLEKESCCGMPKLELGDLQSVEKLKNKNIPGLVERVRQGWDIVAPIPSCTLMYKQELPLMFPDDEDILLVAKHMFDPFEYLMLRHKGNLLNTDFKKPLGKVAYHAACHQRVQRIGSKTSDILKLAGAEVIQINRCSGHDGTYAVKKEFAKFAVKIGKPVATRINQAGAEYYTSDCAMAGHHIAAISGDGSQTLHPMTLLRMAYAI